MELSYFAIIIGAIFVNNVVLAQFLGICPFLGVSSKVETSLGMGAAVTFVMAIAAVVAWLIQTYVLTMLTTLFYGEVSEPHPKKAKKSKSKTKKAAA